jgi:amino acid transporter
VLAFHGSNFHTGSLKGPGGGFMPFGWHGVFAAMPVGVVFALQGFEQAAQLAGEAANPKKDLSRAIITAMAIGASIYLLLEVVFIGALKPANIAHGWANPLGGEASNYGAWYTLALAVGASWLGVILIIDAVISPGGTGLVYLGTTARLSYALGEEEEMPSALTRTNSRGVPVVSIIVAAVVGILAFGPFKSWSELVSVVTDSTAIMYGFGPVALGALHMRNSGHERPYTMPAPKILLPLAFAFADLLIYWSGWDIIWKLDIMLIVGFVIFFVGAQVKQTAALGKVKHALWIAPWLIGLNVLSLSGRYGAWAPGSKGHAWIAEYHNGLPDMWDLLIVIIFSVLVYEYAIRLVMPQSDVDAAIERDAHQINFLAE